MIRIPIRAAAGEYQVLVGRGLLASLGEILGQQGLGGRLRLIADEAVYALYGQELEDRLRAEGHSVSSLPVPSGEPSKSLEMASRIYDWLVDGATERRDVVLALGGGVVGDLAGFVSATFLRGLRFVQLPTSLLAQVDSSVGGKVAVNHPRGKNLIGSFYPPSLVVADLDTLSSLPEREFSALAELVKHGLIMDQEFFRLLEAEGRGLLHPQSAAMEGIIARSIELKAKVVQSDEKETGLRAILNYGHTIGHAVEAVTSYRVYRHGEAVAVGMAGAATMAVELGMIDPGVMERQNRLLRTLGLPLSCPQLETRSIMEAMTRDKKASQGRLAWVLLDRLGSAVVRRDVPLGLVERVVEGLTAQVATMDGSQDRKQGGRK